MTAPVALLPADSSSQDVDARLGRMTQELACAWDRTNQSDLNKWAASVAGDFVESLGRRVLNIGKLAGRVVVFNVDELAGAAKAYREGRLTVYAKDRGNAAWGYLQGLVGKSSDAGTELIEALRRDPRTVAPHLLAMVVTSLVVAGGPDADGGAPDLDLLGGIGAHRSIWTHSILMGATLETGFLALVRLVHLTHENLPIPHDGKWDELAFHAQGILSAVNKGASVGLAYHFLADGLLQPGTYHGVPFEMPQGAHEVIQVVNGVAEGQDVRHKDWLVFAPIWVRKGVHGWPWAQPGYVPLQSRNPSDHEAARRIAFRVDEYERASLSEDEIRTLEKYGTWMEGLMSGCLAPLSPAQEKFVRAAWGLDLVTTPYERAWTAYLTLKYVA